MELLQQLLILLVILLLLAKFAGYLSTKFRQPSVFGKILIGLLIGPSLINIFQYFSHAQKLSFIFDNLAQLGVIILMFIAGLETDLVKMRKVGKVSFWAAFGGVILPFFFGAYLSNLFGYNFFEAVFIGTILTATSVSISAQTLMELKAIKSEEGTAILGAAVIDDVMGIILLSLVIAFAPHADASSTNILGIVAGMIIFFLVSIFLGNLFFEKLGHHSKSFPVSQGFFSTVLIICLFYAWAAEYFGHVAAITGSYIAGALFSLTSHREEITEKMHTIGYSFFIPLFFLYVGMQADFRTFFQNQITIYFMILIILIAIVTKVLGCFFGALIFGFDFTKSLRVGVGMISRGEVGLIVAGYGLAHGIIDPPLFTIMVAMVLITTLITPILLRLTFPKITFPSEVQ